MASDEDTEDRLSQIINGIREWNSPPIDTDSDLPPVEPTLTRSAVFYDKHLPKQLSLRTIVGVPTLLHPLTDIVDNVAAKLVEEDTPLPALSRDSMLVPASEFKLIQKRRRDAADVADYYCYTTARCCEAVSCTFLSPRMPAWLSFLTWGNISQNPPEDVILDNHSLRVVSYKGKETLMEDIIWNSFTEKEKQMFKGVLARFPALATWVILPPSEMAEDIIADLGKGSFPSRSRAFESEICSVQGYADTGGSRFVNTVDSDTCLSFLPKDVHGDGPRGSTNMPEGRRSSRLRGKPGVKEVYETSRKVKLTLPGRHRYNAPFRSLNNRDTILQHAWRMSVENDSTFIIFHCGTMERIGIRRRDSQTLYFSPMIDVANCRRPAYGDVHINLYMAIFQDAVDRYHHLSVAQEDSSGRKRKRASTESNLRRSKRRKGTPSPPSHAQNIVGSDDILPETCARDVAFLALRYGVFDSEAPAAFIRDRPALIPGRLPSSYTPSTHQRQRKYSPHQYINIVITSHIGNGAVGVVHGAQLEVQTTKGKTISSKAVVKLAFSDIQKEKLRYEYSIYERLVGAGVRGISRVFGLFQDMAEEGPLALILSHQGVNLWFCRKQETGPDPEVETSEEECLTFLRILKDIHRAGVAHNDIRGENFLIGDDDGPTIIDFDRATLNPTRGAKQREREQCSLLLKGRFTDPMPSYMIRTPSDAVFSDTDPPSDTNSDSENDWARWTLASVPYAPMLL